MTDSERRLWSCLRSKQMGRKFRRQHPLGPYFATFASVTARLVVEVDGPERDKREDVFRDAWFSGHQWRVLHFTSESVDARIDEVIHAVMVALDPPARGSISSYTVA